MRYLFHVVAPEGVYLDDVGEEFSTPEMAEAHAVTIASELARDETYRGFEVCVIDGRATELARVPVALLNGEG
jgi:hypothetical protein